MKYIKTYEEENNMKKQTKGITLIALVVTIILHYYYCIKYSNSKGFLKAIV